MFVEVQDPIRLKIIDVAGEIFARHGFQAATVREICAQAGVNVASINYYFGDKAALYLEVLRRSTIASHADLIDSGQAGRAPEEILREVIRATCRRMMSSERPSWAYRIMAHEMAQPTPVLEQVVSEVISPKYLRIRTLVGAMLNLPPDHETTRLCAHSIISQVIHYVSSRPVISLIWPELQMTSEHADKLADHIATFSICSIHELARKAQ